MPTIRAPQSWQRKETRAPWGELWGEPGFCPLSPAPQPSGAGVAAGRSLPTPLTFSFSSLQLCHRNCETPGYLSLSFFNQLYFK